MLTGLWNLRDIENSRQNRSKNKLVHEHAAARAHGSCSHRGYGFPLSEIPLWYENTVCAICASEGCFAFLHFSRVIRHRKVCTTRRFQASYKPTFLLNQTLPLLFPSPNIPSTAISVASLASFGSVPSKNISTSSLLLSFKGTAG